MCASRLSIRFAAVSLITIGLCPLPGCPNPPRSLSRLPDCPGDSDCDGSSDDEEINGVPGTDPFDASDNPNQVRNTDGDCCSDFDELNFPGFCNNDPEVADLDCETIGPGDTVGISGRLSVGETAALDGDTNDPNNPVLSNSGDDLNSVQPIPNPCTLGGYLGIRFDALDIIDTFRVQMAQGQAATVMLADPSLNDFDLFLMDESFTILASSEGLGRAEQVFAPADGSFLVVVYGFSVDNDGDPGGLYTLLVGNDSFSATTAASDRLSRLYPSVPGEVLVGYKVWKTRSQRKPADAAFGFEVVNEAVESGGIERLRVKGRPQARLARVSGVAAVVRSTPESIVALKRLKRHPETRYAEPNYIRRASAVPNDEFFPLQWHYPLISLPQAWEVTVGDPNVIVAVIDTGIVAQHPDIQGQLVAGFDFISDPNSARDGDGIDADPSDAGDRPSPDQRSSFHGTHVAGTVAARTQG